MPDIQMCNGINKNSETGKDEYCGVRLECYRHQATPGFIQSWGPPAPDFQESDGCDNYIPIKWVSAKQLPKVL